ncbi:MAG: hypothetical protein NTZ39_09845 [Methanoregula sp.]|nr:hypothetical protein [Methanoregula sp.]
MTYGTIGFGFFRDTVQFRQKVLYWHIIPSSTELGFQCPGKSVPRSMESFAEGIRIQDHLVFTATAGELVKNRSTE